MPTLADYPHRVAQLDRKNGAIDPATLSHGSPRKLWWRCPEGPDHVWEARIAFRARRGNGCPFCAGRRVSVTNALPKLAPAIARQWHPNLNGDLRPRQVFARSHLGAWWKCPMGSDHVWRATVQSRVHLGVGCPFCAGQRATRKHNLALASPHLAAEWHPTRNGAVQPEGVTPFSNRAIWWKCIQGHEWSAAPATRANGHGCPFCAGQRVTPETSLAARSPALARQWHPTRNGDLTPRDVTAGSTRRVWWECRRGPDHVWEAAVGQRQGKGCPFCSGQRISVTNALAVVSPALAAEWHPTKNGSLGAGDVTPGSNRRVWWKCPAGPDHEWDAVVVNRRAGGGCPFCRGLRISVTNALDIVEPRLASEWHPTKNGALTPHDVTRSSNRRIWWRCAFAHEWHVTVNARTSRGSGCRVCYQQGFAKKAATTRKPRTRVRLAEYEGPHHGPVRRVR